MANAGTASDFLAAECVASMAAERSGQVLWVGENGERTWRDFGDLLESSVSLGRAAGVQPGEVVLVPLGERLESLAWCLGAALLGAAVLLADADWECGNFRSFLRIAWRAADAKLERVGKGENSPHAQALIGRLRAVGHPGLILATGGTTGEPKLVLHDLAKLLGSVPVRSGRPWRIMPLMRFSHIGGLDVALRALASGQVLVQPPKERTAEAVAAVIAARRVEVLPATPSFLNLLLISGCHLTHDLSSLELVPYGAEPMPAPLLRRLEGAFPGIRFVQRFGTSETGGLPVVSLASGLRMAPGSGYEWKVVDGELLVSSPTQALGYLNRPAAGPIEGGWYKTGDAAVQDADGTVRVLGRRMDFINVGGEKVLPGEVEAFLLGHPKVEDCRVYPEANSILGEVVCAQIVWRDGEADPVAVKEEIRRFAGDRVARRLLPSVVRLVPSVGSTANLKKVRFARP